jgi:hypothetical protein
MLFKVVDANLYSDIGLVMAWIRLLQLISAFLLAWFSYWLYLL